MHVSRQVLADVEIFSLGPIYLEAISRLSHFNVQPEFYEQVQEQSLPFKHP